VPGSIAIGSVDIFQEGLRLPLLKLHDAGVENTAIWDILAANVRVPDKVIGDVRAQVASCLTGEREFRALFRRYGSATLRACFAAIHDHAERLARAEFAAIPDGTYRFENAIDGLGEQPEPIRLKVAVTVSGSDISVDWTGTEKQVKAGINAPIPFTRAAAHAALRAIVEGDVPNCQGFTRPVGIIAPQGTIANPLPPAACGARGITGFRMIDCMLGALAQAVPDRVTADGNGGATLPSIGGWHEGKPFVFVETIMGNWGAAHSHDGQDGVAHIGANQSNVPVEMIELEYPLRIEQYALVTDSGGAGTYRGGLGLVRDFRILCDEATLTVRSDKRRFPPFGLQGGHTGAPSWNIINPGPAQHVLPVLTMQPVLLREGDLYRHVMAGAGGFGAPERRDPALVLRDVVLGKVSLEQARDTYRVALVICDSEWAIDAAATAAMRAA
jgi:N-methylhydantoinase B